MVFGNLSTGYWLGAAAAAGIHWQELGRTTLGSTGDTINVNGIDLSTATYGGADITTDLTWTQTIGSSTSDTFYILKDTSADIMDIKAAGNCGTDASPSIAYATLAEELSTAAWTIRFKLVFNTVTAESTGGKSFFTGFHIVDSGTGTAGTGSESGFGFKFIADAGSTQSQFYSISSGTDSGTTMNWTPSGSNTIYAEISYSGGTATANFYSDSGYSSNIGSSTANVTRSGTFSGLKYPQIVLRQDTGGNGVMEIDMSELKIYNGGLTAKPYMMVLEHSIASGTTASSYRFNSDTGSNYAQRYSIDGAADGTSTSIDKIPTLDSHTDTGFATHFIINTSSNEKLMNGHSIYQSSTGSGTAPTRLENNGKWANTSNNITSLNAFNYGSGDYASGSEVVVLGYDPADTEGTSVWEELASVELGSSSSSLSSGTIAAKKYLWVQAYLYNTGTMDTGLRFNSDTGNNYAERRSDGGGSDATSTSTDHFNFDRANKPNFVNIFIINKSDKEKMIIAEAVSEGTAGAGNAPRRRETVGKWANTSAQITNISFTKLGSGADLEAPSSIKVWGFD